MLRVKQLARSTPSLGLLIGALFFAAALTPTLVPRGFVLQGVLAGLCFVIGCGLGVLVDRLWRASGMPWPQGRLRCGLRWLAALAAAGVAALFLRQATAWQNSIRAALALEPLSSANPLLVCLVALAAAWAALGLALLFRRLARRLAGALRRAVPPRTAAVLGAVLAILVVWLLVNGIIVRLSFRALDASYRELDALFEPERPQPADSGKTGSPASLIPWGSLGRAGREFVASGPTAEAIEAATGQHAREPLRIYVGLRSAETPRERAKLALAEMRRQGAFGRSVLVVIAPTGTGWIDPAAVDSLEYLQGGDTASVAAQYSYLNSPLSLLAEPDVGAETTRALFDAVYGHWTALAKDRRPRLYLHGLSLGALNSERSAELFETIGDPIQGALWSGPPFESRIWPAITARRNQGSPQWLPTFRDGRFVRFMNQHGSTLAADAPWGPMRVVYLQYASDPVVFFSRRSLYRRPDWMSPPFGPDVSPELRWYPVVTGLQLALDMALATTTPMGYGHVYAPEHYVDAWAAVTDVRDWPPERLAGLKRGLAAAARRAEGDEGDDGAAYEDRGG